MWEEHALADKPPAVSARWEHFAQIGQKRLKNVLTRRLASIVINLNACSVPEDLKWSGTLQCSEPSSFLRQAPSK